MPVIEISDEAYALLKAESERNSALMTKSAGEWFRCEIDEIADTILRRELDPNTRRDEDNTPF